MKRVIYRRFKALPPDKKGGEKEILFDRPLGKIKTCLQLEWDGIKNLKQLPSEAIVKLDEVEDGQEAKAIEKIRSGKEVKEKQTPKKQ